MNAFQQLLKSSGGHPPLGTWILSAHGLIAEAIGHAGFDWAVIDMEHAPLDIAGLAAMLQAVACTKTLPIVRLPWNDTVIVKRALDAGATTLMFPYVQNAAEAARAVAATRYPPEGVRGIVGMSRASRFGTTPQYLQHANRGIGVVLQLESPQALAELEAIARVPGVDALLIGPADLSAAMGHLAHIGHPAVLEAMAQAVRRSKAIGMPIGTVGGTPESVAQLRATGFDFVAIGSDLDFMMNAAKAALAALRTGNSEHVHLLSTGTRSA